MAHPLRPGVAGGIRQLDQFLSRYWNAAEADLAFRGVDLLAAFQECRVRYLLNLLMSLPRNTLFQEALLQDDELVEQYMRNRPKRAVGDDDEAPAMRIADFSPEVEALSAIADRLGDVVSAVVASAGSRPPRIPRVRRPETAVQRFERVLERERHERLKRQLLPNG